MNWMDTIKHLFAEFSNSFRIMYLKEIIKDYLIREL